MEKKAINPNSKRSYYLLTQKGLSTATIIIALIQWCDKWILSPGEIPMILKDRLTNKKIPNLKIQNESGDEINIWDIITTPGPGATKSIDYRFK